jgi:Bacterial PH domain
MMYRSKVDLWLAAVLISGPLIPIGTAISTRQTFPLAIAVFMLVVYRLVVFPTFYETDSDKLVIRNGVFKKNVLYSEIRSMRPTRCALSSPALSLDRIEIRYAQAGVVLISPADRRAFLEDMRVHAPQADISSK